MMGYVGNEAPRVRAEESRELYLRLWKAIQEGLVASCHDCSDGGLGVALAEVAFSGSLGMEVDLREVPQEGVERDDYLLFSESQSRFVVTVHPEHRKAFEELMEGVPFSRIGVVREERAFRVTGLGGKRIIEADIFRLKEAWQRPLRF